MSNEQKDSLSLTSDNLNISDIIEPLTVIRLDIDDKSAKLDAAIIGIKEFFNKKFEKDDAVITKDKDEKLLHPVPYCYDPDNQTEFTRHANTISKTLSAVIEVAKTMRQELYIKPDDSKPSFQVPAAIEPKQPDQQPQRSRTNFITKQFKKIRTDPNSPLSRMEKSIQALEYIQQEIWRRALAWHEVDVSSAKIMKLGYLGDNTKLGMEIEASSWVAVFGYYIVPNILMAFEYGSKLRLNDAERYAIEVVTATQKQQEKDKQREFTRGANNFS